ncbi:MAG: fatty acid desaturase CarF family protein [Candidatus Altimarinota bacterium]
MNQVIKKKGFQFFQIFATSAFFILMFLFAWKLIQYVPLQYSLQGNWLFLSSFAAAFIAYLSADFASGMLHFLCDNFGSKDTFLIGKHFIQPFRQHHDDPLDITLHGFIETNANNCVVCLPVLIPLYFFLPQDSILFYSLAVFFWFFLIWIFATNQFHKWAHQKKPTPLIIFLQKLHLILPIDHHQIHHTVPYDKYYCITNGWLNAFLSKIGFFETILRIFKKKPGNSQAPKHS